MISYDYWMLAGVQRAFQELRADKPETVLERATTRALIVKGVTAP